MKKLIVLPVFLFLLTAPLWVNAGSNWEGVLAQVDHGRLQLAVTLHPSTVPVLPEVLTREEAIEWLGKGWLVPEKSYPLKAPAPGQKCHIIYEPCPFGYCQTCVDGPGVVRCPCGNAYIDYYYTD